MRKSVSFSYFLFALIQSAAVLGAFVPAITTTSKSSFYGKTQRFVARDPLPDNFVDTWIQRKVDDASTYVGPEENAVQRQDEKPTTSVAAGLNITGDLFLKVLIGVNFVMAGLMLAGSLNSPPLESKAESQQRRREEVERITAQQQRETTETDMSETWISGGLFF